VALYSGAGHRVDIGTVVAWRLPWDESSLSGDSGARSKVTSADDASRVALPDAVSAPLEVYVNGVPQERGRDYHVQGRELVFNRSLEQEGRLGLVRWLSIFLGFAGTYRRHDSVDVVYEVGGRRLVASGLPPLSAAAETRSPG
jgi:hypothetical protein